MDYTDKEYCIEVRGDFACFTRPELKVERVSYDVITPSAARNIFQAIFFVKGAMQWQVTRIEVLNPIRRISVRRNEVSSTMSLGSGPFFVEDSRTQRTAYILRDVAYRLYAKLVYIPLAKRSAKDQELTKAKLKEKGTSDENPGKYYGEFERRISRGGCFYQPYLGCREFSCSFEWISDASYQQGIDETRNLGIMLYDMDYPEEMDTQAKPKAKVKARAPQPMFFEAYMEHGVITVPEPSSPLILR